MLNAPKFNLGPTDPGPNPFEAATSDLKKALEGAKEILVLIRDNPRLDHVAAGLSLYLSLKEAGKSVTIASPTEMRVEFNRLVGVDKVATKIGNRNLVLSFPQEVKDSIEKVSYNMDDGNFNLVIQPKAGYPALDSTKVEYSYTGADAQLIFSLGAQKLEDLGIFYQSERQLFEQATVVNIDAVPTNTRFGRINLVWADFTSSSEIVTELIERMGLSLNQDIATNLLSGMNEATQNFQRFNLKATAFEAAAKLMKAGGKRPMGAPAFGAPGAGNMSPFGPVGGSPTPFANNRPFPNPGGFNNPFMPPNPMNPAPNPYGNFPQQFPAPIPQATSPAPGVNPVFNRPIPPAPQSPAPASSIPSVFEEPPLYPQPAPQTAPLANPPSNIKTPTNDTDNDWLKPKIFTGSSKIS